MNANDNDAASEMLIREVDDDLRHEQYVRLWRLYGKYLITAAVAIVLGVAGGQVWQGWRARQQDAASRAFALAESQIAAGKTDDALKTLAPLETGHQAGFAIAASMRHASALSEKGDLPGATAAYETIIASGAPSLYRDLAVLKLALLTLDSADPDALQKRVAPLAETSSPWRYTATEVLALLAHRKGDVTNETKFYKQLADDIGAPQSIRSRANEMLATLPTPPSILDKPKG